MSKDPFHEFCDELEKQIIKKDIKDHNERIVQLFRNPLNWGRMPENELSISRIEKGKKGELLEFYIKIDSNGIVQKTSFFTNGCGCIVAVASQATLLIEGKNIMDVKEISLEDIKNALGGLPDEEKHCAELVVFTLKKLVKDYNSS
ncbi:MAG: iron-sulfur cluster assembly scaffold protein [Candidatus Lokiarchaeota archaeon]|nr:iron-sulfur cluster assembly scaffold protein [Candidatus Lokiarchaeota archaeon]